MSPVLMISADCHATASRAGYREYIEPSVLDDFDRWVESVDGTDEGLNAHPRLDESVNWDSDLRLAALELEGTVAEVIFPNALPFGYSAVGFDIPAGEEHRAMAAVRAYNRWLTDFCAAAPGRRAGIALVRFEEMDEALETVRSAAERGMRGVGLPGPGGHPWYFDRTLDPFWEACQEAGLPVVAHAPGITPRPIPEGFAALMTLALESDFFAGRSLWQMMFGGVFDRYPDLRYVVTEGGADWITQRLDEIERLIDRKNSWRDFAEFIGRESTMQRRAWEYWQDNCFVGASFMSRGEARRRHEIGTDKIMFGLVFPHFESTTGKTKRWIQSTLGSTGTTDDELRAILGLNAAAVYGFDVGTLQPRADVVGFDADELLQPAAHPINDFRSP